MKLHLILVVLFSSFFYYSLASYDYNTNCQVAFRQILDLKTNTAREILDKEKGLHPDNSYVLYLEHYADAVELIILEDASRYEKFYEDYYTRREIMDKEDATSPYHKLLEAEMLFHMGLAQLKYGNKIYGARKIYSSYSLIKDNQKQYPDFWMNLKMDGVYNVLFANIPISIRWAARIIGVNGNLDTGIQQMKSYFEKAKSLPGYAEEGALFLNFAYKYLWNDESGLDFLSGLDPKLRESTLVKYFYANQAASSGKNDLALNLLGSIRKGDYQVPFYGLDYLEGYCRLNRLDNNSYIYLSRYLDTFPGLDYKKDMCMRLSWYYLLQGDDARYKEYKEMVGEVGSDLRDHDREATIENKLDYLEHPGLLKARLLCDGGYFTEAENILSGIPASYLNQKQYKLEYSYRYGVICQELGNYAQAIVYFTQTILAGQNDPYPFACLAAYQLGTVFEIQKDFNKALTYYHKSRDLFNSGYTVETIEAKAEKGEERAEKMMEK